MLKNGLLSLCVALLALGCVTSGVTNLTPTKVKRTPNNLYHIEYQWNSNQQTLRPETITPTVVVGQESYPMRKVPKMRNRWEAYIPVPPDQKAVNYRFKIDYDYNRFGKTGKDSMLSPEYKLVIED